MADNEKENQNPGSSIDLDKILLPKKETPGTTPQSAQRVSAGLLVAQEEKAATDGPTPQVSTPKETPVEEPAKPPANEDEVRPLQTYHSDIESLVQKGGVSEVSIAAAEAMRKEKKEEVPAEPTPEREAGWWKKWVYVGAGSVLLIASVILIIPVVLRTSPVPTPQGTHTGIIYVDEITAVEVLPQRQGTMGALVAARDDVNIPLGLIEQIWVTADAKVEQPLPYPITDLLLLFAPAIPTDLLRTLKPEYILGVHSYDHNQPFLIVQADSYDVTYRAMLEWERSMRADLIPLFNRTISPQLSPTPPSILPPVGGSATSTATSTATTTAAATTTVATSSAFSIPETPEESVVIATPFIDRIVENRDTRAIVDQQGNILLLWTFLNRETILITTNEATLREVITRVAATPIQYQPQSQ